MDKKLKSLYRKLNKISLVQVDPVVQAKRDIEKFRGLCHNETQVKVLVLTREIQLENKIKRIKGDENNGNLRKTSS